MLRIGLTGPTGSGKSTVTALMRRWGGVAILDADTIAHEVNNSPACAAAIAAAFPGARLPDGTIDHSTDCEKEMDDGAETPGRHHFSAHPGGVRSPHGCR